MGTNACVLALLLMAIVTAVTCTTDIDRVSKRCDKACKLRILARPDPLKKKCDTRCKLKALARPAAGKRTASFDLNPESYPWQQGDTSPTYTADVKTEERKSTCLFDEVLKQISPKWQERLLSVLEGALMESRGEEVDDGSYGL